MPCGNPESPQLPSALSLQPWGSYKHLSELGTKEFVHFAVKAGLWEQKGSYMCITRSDPS